MSLGFYSPNLSSKNVLDSFFKLIGILLILSGTAPASLFSADFSAYCLGPCFFVPATVCPLLS